MLKILRVQSGTLSATGPRPTLAAPQVGDEDPDLDGERSGQRLTHCNRLAYLLFREPDALSEEFAFS